METELVRKQKTNLIQRSVLLVDKDFVSHFHKSIFQLTMFTP